MYSIAGVVMVDCVVAGGEGIGGTGGGVVGLSLALLVVRKKQGLPSKSTSSPDFNETKASNFDEKTSSFDTVKSWLIVREKVVGKAITLLVGMLTLSDGWSESAGKTTNGFAQQFINL